MYEDPLGARSQVDMGQDPGDSISRRDDGVSTITWPVRTISGPEKYVPASARAGSLQEIKKVFCNV